MKIISAVMLFTAVFVSFVHAQTSPTIASISDSRRLTQGEALSLSVSVNGTAPFTYVWKKAGVAISGQTSSTYTIAAIAVADGGSYTVTVTNGGGSITSDPILIDVTAATAPSFYSQPSNVSYTIGDTINLSLSASGTYPWTVEWKKGTTTVATGANSYYTKANAQATDAGTYTVTITNVAGSVTSSPFTITVNAAAAPSFYYGPYGGTYQTGDYLSLYAYVERATGVTYQWFKDGVAIPNATNNSYGKSNLTTADAGIYTVVATNGVGSTTSGNATVVVNPPAGPTNLSISNGPLTVTVGESLSLYSSVNGTGPFTYQWRKDGTAITGATSSSFYKANVAAEDTGVYSLVVTNSVSSATSGDTTVSVSNAQVPIITVHPASVTVYPGTGVALSVSATGTGSLNYQWKKDDVVISNATSSYFYITSSAAASDAGTYTVVVTNTQGSTTSRPASVAVLAARAPVILRHPSGRSLVPGQTLQLSVEASGNPYPTYQWKKDGVDLPGATNSGYYKDNVASSDSGNYSVVVTNSAGSVTSQTAAVSVGVGVLPVISGHPASGSLLLGDYLSFLSVYTANYVAGTTVQWYRNGAAIAGATSYSYSISNAQPTHAGTYKAVVTTSDGQSVTSYNGVVTVDLTSARPAIIYTSGSQAVAGGNSVSISINVSPALSNYTVVWKKDGVAVPNATALYLNFYDFSAVLGGTYTAEVTAAGNTYTSQPIILSLLDAGVSPSITLQPASQTRNVTEYASFSVSAAGERPITYQWRKDGVAIPNATGDSYSVGNVTAVNAGNYSAVVTNHNGSVTSDVAALTVNSIATAVPILAQQPVSQTLTAGTYYLSLGISLLNQTNNETYQWYKDGVEIAGATFSSYGVYQPVIAANAGRYKVAVTNSAGTTTSDEALIVVTTRSTGPVFSTQPASQIGYTAGTATFTAAATSTSSVSYQWRKNGTAITGATGSSLTLSGLQTSDAGAYTVVASDADGSTASAVAQLTVTGSIAPVITSQPTSQVGGRGGAASFTVAATGTPTPTFQWKKNGIDIGGATAATLSWSSLSAGDGGNYTVVVSNSGGAVTSNTVSLTVFDQQPYSPTFIVHPQGRAYAPGETVTLTVEVSGLPSPTLQWYKDGAAIGGAQSTTLSLGKMDSSMAGQYHAVATNVLGSASSHVATITLGAATERLVNVSARGVAGKDSNTLIAGFVIGGSGQKHILLRAVGPTLIPLGVSGALTNPRLKLFKSSTPILENDDWSSGSSATEIAAAATRLGAQPLAVGSADAALLTSLEPGVYSAHVTTNDSSTGVALLEVYDADEAGSGAKVVNLSSRGPVGRGDDIMIVGFVINGSAPKKVLVRGVGPALTPLGVTGALVDPKLQLFKGSTVIFENDNWSAGADATDIANAATSCGASSLPVGSKDAAILVSLAPGVYSAHVRGVGDTTGVALIEMYEVP